MGEALSYLASFAAGALLGLVFFWGLWSTLQGIERARHPVLRLLGSLLMRFGLVLTVFLLLARYAGWPHVLTATLGFTLARLFVPGRVSRLRLTKESDA